MTDHVSPSEPGDARPVPRRRGWIAAGVVAGVLVVLVVGYGVAYALSGNALPPRAAVAGIAVGGLSHAEAQAKLTAGLAAKASEPIIVKVGEKSTKFTSDQLGMTLDAVASIRAAGGEKSFDPRVIWNNLTGGGPNDAVITIDDAKADAALAGLASSVHVAAENATLEIVEGAPKVTESKQGAELGLVPTKDALKAAYLRTNVAEGVVVATDPEITTDKANQARQQVAEPALSGPITINGGGKKFEVAPAAIGAALTFEPTDGALVPKVNPDTLMESEAKQLAGVGMRSPKDASFTFTGGRPTVVPSVDGIGVSKENLAKAVTDTMTKTSDRAVTVEIGPVKADFTTEDAQKLGVKEVTGEFTTKFPATAYRVTNIGKSAGLVNSVLVKPGETFSMNKVLGPRTLARGWKAGGAIDGGKVVQRMGGGISQTTTTTFNAIFFAGLQDVYHKPHSLYFNRYPMGREATLDYVSVDMKFKNNTEYGVLMQAYTNNPKVGGQGTVTVKVWSTKVFEVKASKPVQSQFRSPGPPVQSDAAVCSPQSPMQGFRVDFNRLFYKAGALVKTEPFHWTYNTLQEVTCTNPGARPDRVER